MDEILSGLGNRVFVMDDGRTTTTSRFYETTLGIVVSSQKSHFFGANKIRRSCPSKSSYLYPNVIPKWELTEASVSPSPPHHAVMLYPLIGLVPVMPPGIPEFFVPRRCQKPGYGRHCFSIFPHYFGVARLHYADRKAGVDQWETLSPLPARLVQRTSARANEKRANHSTTSVPELDRAPEPPLSTCSVPGKLARVKNYGIEGSKSLKSYLYREPNITIMVVSGI